MILSGSAQQAQVEWSSAFGVWKVCFDADVHFIQRGVRSLKNFQRFKERLICIAPSAGGVVWFVFEDTGRASGPLFLDDGSSPGQQVRVYGQDVPDEIVVFPYARGVRWSKW